jgi:hypothetical protein
LLRPRFSAEKRGTQIAAAPLLQARTPRYASEIARRLIAGLFSILFFLSFFVLSRFSSTPRDDSRSGSKSAGDDRH